MFRIYTYLSILVMLERSWFSRFLADTIKPLTGYVDIVFGHVSLDTYLRISEIWIGR